MRKTGKAMIWEAGCRYDRYFIWELISKVLSDRRLPENLNDMKEDIRGLIQILAAAAMENARDRASIVADLQFLNLLRDAIQAGKLHALCARVEGVLRRSNEIAGEPVTVPVQPVTRIF